ncbi:DNA cytosine methyltransferase [Mycolicibacterium sp. S2-37]|uniref:DNA cytosine methyltransferase n=1 Tax=Mycolicibacterium sp. S2-37 TaxID=2810297 RepID=UPI001A94E61B|nr:DNA cytosine methyltransferase [Mycolicibacterium sp. S2-37]MBO0677185.1 DNA cytosine methyltransferase [Mycolicibacterium sp. S2-37]
MRGRDELTKTAAGLFAGIGGLEVGLARSGWETALLCEIEPSARAVLRHRMPDVELHENVVKLRGLPKDVDLVAAGFPCQDLSQAGRTQGITGAQSGLVGEVFRLIKRKNGPRWLLLENVSFMLQLDRGEAMRHLTASLNDMGYRWAYRVVDARAFGLPQRRHRVIMLASRTEDPRPVLFGQDAGAPPEHENPADYPCGFYWTEGVRGLGWAVDAVPTIKGGSALGIASPPAVWLKSGEIVTPGIVDAERLQGFDAGWTEPAREVSPREGHRWKLVGNAVSTRMSEWVGSRLDTPASDPWAESTPLKVGDKWPRAAWGDASGTYTVAASMWPVRDPYEHLEGFLQNTKPLSARAAAGFLNRARAGSLRFVPGFLDDVAAHQARMAAAQAVA